MLTSTLNQQTITTFNPTPFLSPLRQNCHRTETYPIARFAFHDAKHTSTDDETTRWDGEIAGLPPL
jgi:hypothetical protein